MRIGVSSRGTSWVSGGCVFWLLAYPVVAAVLLVVFLVRLLILLGVACWRGCARLAARYR